MSGKMSLYHAGCPTVLGGLMPGRIVLCHAGVQPATLTRSRDILCWKPFLELNSELIEQ